MILVSQALSRILLHCPCGYKSDVVSTQACSAHILKQYLSADAVKLPGCCVRRLCKWKPVSEIKEDSLDEKMEYVQKIKQE